jgi:hypothetical protein
MSRLMTLNFFSVNSHDTKLKMISLQARRPEVGFGSWSRENVGIWCVMLKPMNQGHRGPITNRCEVSCRYTRCAFFGLFPDIAQSEKPAASV